MAQQTIGIGTSANDGTGDPLRTAFTKINTNFTELYGDTAEANDILEDASPQLGGNLDINGWNITSARSNEDIVILPNGTGGVVASALRIAGTTLSADDSSLITIAEGLQINGATNIDGAITAASTLDVTGLSTLASLTVTGAMSITGTLALDNLNISDNNITSDSNADINITPGGTGNVVVGAVTFNGTTLSATDSSKITLAEALDVTGATTLGSSLTVGTTLGVTGAITGTTSVTAASFVTTGNAITITDNRITTGASNADINITPHGTGNIVAGALTINGTTISAADSSKITIAEAVDFTGAATVVGTLTTADITTVGTQTITGTLNADYVQIKDNKITTNASSANLEIAANGSGTIDIQNAMTTLGQTVTGDATISGVGTFGNVTMGDNYITVTNSNGGLAINPYGNGIVTIGGKYVAIPSSLLAGDVFVTSEFQLGTNAEIVQTVTNEDMVFVTNGTGTIRINNAQTQMTVGAVGAASKLPLDSANEVRPVGYFKLSLDGTTYAIPYFNAS